MPNPFRRKVKTPEEKKYVFCVTDIMTWQVEIMRYVYVRHTEKTVTVLDTSNRERKHPWKGSTADWFIEIADARAAAAIRLTERRKKLASYAAMIDKSEKKIESRKVMDMKPMEKFDMNEKDYKF